MTSPLAASSTVLAGGASTVSSVGRSPSRLVDCWAATAGPPTQGKMSPATSAPATTTVAPSLSSVLARASVRRSMGPLPWSATRTGNDVVHNDPRRAAGHPDPRTPHLSRGEQLRQVPGVQYHQGADRPGEDDVEPVQPARLGGGDRGGGHHHDRVELQPLRQRGRDDGQQPRVAVL